MTIRELSRDQLQHIKQHYLTQRREEAGEGVSWGELAAADELITDQEIFEAYSDMEFSEDDFL